MLIKGLVTCINKMKTLTATYLICTSIFLSLNGYAADNGKSEVTKSSLDHAFTLLLNISDTPKFSDRQTLKSNYNDFVNDLKLKKQKWNNDHRLLRHVFYSTHREYLKKYEPYQSFQDIFWTGTYGCLTGTALYAFLMEELGFNYEIIETNYHMFLLVKTDDKEYLIESTDPAHGFVHSKKAISHRIKEAIEYNRDDSRSYAFKYDIYKSVSHIELIGLQYYNTAIDAYNNENFVMTLYCLNEASRINPSERISAFIELLEKSVNDQNILHNALTHFDELSLFIRPDHQLVQFSN